MFACCGRYPDQYCSGTIQRTAPAGAIPAVAALGGQSGFSPENGRSTSARSIERYHAETLRHVIAKVNDDVAEHEAKQRRIEEQRRQAEAQHRREIDEISDRLDFG